MIDYVIPMVFPDDQQWQRDLTRAFGWNHSDSVRYRSWGMEALLVECIRKFMPWVRDIIVLLARESQRQPWMKDVRVVYHREFIPEAYLPTFNSRTIEMFLHRIPGLSERFLYGNDDMFPIAPLREEDFFVGDMPCQNMTVKPYPENPNNFQLACMAGLNFVAEEFGQHYTKTWLKNGHSIAPILRQVCEHLWERGEQEILKSISPFREPKNFNQYIYAWWQYFAGLSIDRTPNRFLLTANNYSPQAMTGVILDKKVQIVCINDHEDCNDIQPYVDATTAAIRQRLTATA